MIMPIRNNPGFQDYFGDDADSMLKFLWDFFPASMIIIRFEEPGNFVVEAVNPTQQAMLSSKKIYVGEHLSHIFPESLCDELIANCGHCVADGVPVRYEMAGGYIDGEYHQTDCQILLKPISTLQGVITHLLCIVNNPNTYSRSKVAHYSELEIERRVMERTDELTTINQQLSYLATHDWLTEAFNRRHLLELATTEFKRVYRYGLSLGLLMLDIDHFKSINDEKGHAAGDQALQTVTRAIRATVRNCDLVGRYGGDEFIIVLPETDLHGARVIAERLSSTLQGAELFISIGLATLERNDQTIDDVINRADHLLLSAKRNGRNRIESASLTLIS